jgi:hypothetical protein
LNIITFVTIGSAREWLWGGARLSALVWVDFLHALKSLIKGLSGANFIYAGFCQEGSLRLSKKSPDD